VYGGNGQTSFALPNLQGRIPLHMGSGFTIGETGGEASHTLTLNELPTHTHIASATTTPGTPGTSPNGALPGPGPQAIYAVSPNAAMMANTVSAIGGGQPHENQAPYLVLSMIIALQGIFPSRT
jgi:microcystin-dependent protein